MMKEKLSMKNLQKHEKEILNKMRFFDVCIYHGMKPIQECLEEAIRDKFQLPDSVFHEVFGIHIEDYTNYLYTKVEE